MQGVRGWIGPFDFLFAAYCFGIFVPGAPTLIVEGDEVHLQSNMLSNVVPTEHPLRSQLTDDALSEIKGCGSMLMPATEICAIYEFKVDDDTFHGEWRNASRDVSVRIGKKIASGGMRVCHSARLKNLPTELSSVHSPFGWVAKLYKGNHADEETWSSCCRDIQGQETAKNLNGIFLQLIRSHDTFGDFPRVNPSFFAQRIGKPQYFSIEPRINFSEERYLKFLNNDGLPTKDGLHTELGQKSQAFAHWSLEYTRGLYLLCDVQGTHEVITDIQVASKEEGSFGRGNLGGNVFDTFISSHKCNRFCDILGLNKLVLLDERREEDAGSDVLEKTIVDNSADDAEPSDPEHLFESLQTRNYLGKQDGVSSQMRANLIAWLIEHQVGLKIHLKTLHLGVKIVDHLLQIWEVSTDELELVGATSLIVACFREKRQPPSIEHLISICKGKYQNCHFTTMEERIIQSLKRQKHDFKTPYGILSRYEKAAFADDKTLTLARFLLESSLLLSEFITYEPSLMAASCLCLALRMTKNEWTSTLARYTGHTKETLEQCVLKLNKMNAAPPDKNLEMVKAKYKVKEFHEVAIIPALDGRH